MKRVAVLGCSGAGKTTLARRLGDALDVPVVHGDDHRPEWEELQPALVARDAWVIDAMRINTLDERLARADTAIFLDLPTWALLRGVAERWIRSRGRAFVSREMLAWMLRFRRRHRPQIVALLERHAATTEVVVLRSRREVDAFCG